MECPIIKQAYKTAEGRIYLQRAAYQYLWDSGDGCNGESLWEKLPRDLVILIIKSSNISYMTWILLDRRTSQIAPSYAPYNVGNLSKFSFFLIYTERGRKMMVRNPPYIFQGFDPNQLQTLSSDAIERLTFLANKKPNFFSDAEMVKILIRHCHPLRDAALVHLFAQRTGAAFTDETFTSENRTVLGISDHTNATHQISYNMYRELARNVGITMPAYIPEKCESCRGVHDWNNKL